MVNKFKIGDKVRANKDYPDTNRHVLKGDTGIVVRIHHDTRVGVDWGRDVQGHNCARCCTHGQGWNVDTCDLELNTREEDDYGNIW